MLSVQARIHSLRCGSLLGSIYAPPGRAMLIHTSFTNVTDTRNFCSFISLLPSMRMSLSLDSAFSNPVLKTWCSTSTGPGLSPSNCRNATNIIGGMDVSPVANSRNMSNDLRLISVMSSCLGRNDCIVFRTSGSLAYSEPIRLSFCFGRSSICFSPVYILFLHTCCSHSNNNARSRDRALRPLLGPCRIVPTHSPRHILVHAATFPLSPKIQRNTLNIHACRTGITSENRDRLAFGKRNPGGASPRNWYAPVFLLILTTYFIPPILYAPPCC